MTNTPFKILIVDDDKFLVEMYSLKFSEQGWEVTAALSGEEALEKIEGGLRPDVYLIDILMPKVDGFQVIEKLQELKLDESAVLVILSNLGQQSEVDKGLSMGVDGYIIKASATPTEVVARIMEIAKNKKTK